MSESTVQTRGQFDYVGAALLSIALTALLLAISKGGTWGWASEPIIVLLVIAVAALAIWFPYELKVGQPLVDLRTSARRPVLLTNIASVLVGFAMFANLLLTTQQLQLPESTGYGFGFSVVAAGLAMVPCGLAMVLFAPVSGRMINRYGGRITLITGSAVLMGCRYLGRVYFSGTVLVVIVGSTAGQHRHRHLLRGDADADHGVGADHRNRLRQRVELVAPGDRHVHLERRRGGHPGLGHPPGRVRRRCRRSPRSRTSIWMTGTQRADRMRGRPGTSRPPVRGARPRPAATSGCPRPSPRPARTPRSWSAAASCNSTNTPIHPAVITVMKTDGTPVDWSRADNQGNYSVVLPGPG